MRSFYKRGQLSRQRPRILGIVVVNITYELVLKYYTYMYILYAVTNLSLVIVRTIQAEIFLKWTKAARGQTEVPFTIHELEWRSSPLSVQAKF